jgi:hypothetical protein
MVMAFLERDSGNRSFKKRAVGDVPRRDSD